MQKSKVEGQLVQKMEWKRTDTPFVALDVYLTHVAAVDYLV